MAANNTKKQEAEMSFLDHLEELRWHLIRSTLAVVIIGTVAFIFIDFFGICQYFKTFFELIIYMLRLCLEMINLIMNDNLRLSLFELTDLHSFINETILL